MSQLAFLPYYHGANWSDWIAHRVVSAGPADSMTGGLRGGV